MKKLEAQVLMEAVIVARQDLARAHESMFIVEQLVAYIQPTKRKPKNDGTKVRL